MQIHVGLALILECKQAWFQIIVIWIKPAYCNFEIHTEKTFEIPAKNTLKSKEDFWNPKKDATACFEWFENRITNYLLVKKAFFIANAWYKCMTQMPGCMQCTFWLNFVFLSYHRKTMQWNKLLLSFLMWLLGPLFDRIMQHGLANPFGLRFVFLS